MAQVLIRNLDDGVVERLRERAAREGRSLEAELRIILGRAAETPATVTAEMERIRSLLAGRHFGDSTGMIREDRER